MKPPIKVHLASLIINILVDRAPCNIPKTKPKKSVPFSRVSELVEVGTQTCSNAFKSPFENKQNMFLFCSRVQELVAWGMNTFRNMKNKEQKTQTCSNAFKPKNNPISFVSANIVLLHQGGKPNIQGWKKTIPPS